jgi:1-acyl-sn-glycerol-3-phosphate acyltransferase
VTAATRRLVTIPLYFVLLGAALALLPLALPAALLSDWVRRTPLAATRTVLFFVWYLAFECVGLAAAFGVWLWKCVLRPGEERWREANVRLKCAWARGLLAGARLLFGMRVEVEDEPVHIEGPLLLFMRHASTADTILTSVLLTHRHGIDFRHVIKRELLWDPCLDVVGNRLPNYFVDRSSTDSPREIAGVQALARDLGPRDGVLIYPEGTRFTPEKQARILERLEARGDADLLARARALTCVLPPRLGGPLGLLDAAPEADVLFCAHVGFEGIQSFHQFLRGGLVNRTIQVVYWRVPAAEVPRDRDARIDWLFDWWGRIDRWVHERAKEAS